MKIAVIGIDLPLGKKPFLDARLEKLKEIVHSTAVTHIQVEFVDAARLKDADAVLAEKTAKLDLILADLEIIDAQLNSSPENQTFLRSKETLEKEILLNEVPFTDAEKKPLLGFNLVTLKPVVFLQKDNLPSIPDLVGETLSHCGMISFFTANERELRAWSIKKGTTVFEAAGSIHSDLRRGFIKAEVVGYEELIKSGGLNQARGKGLLRLEDKGYLVRDGDLIQIRFNV